MDSDAQLHAGGSKRKAVDSAPERQSQSKTILSIENDKKRRDILNAHGTSAQEDDDYSSLDREEKEEEEDDEEDDETDEDHIETTFEDLGNEFEQVDDVSGDDFDDESDEYAEPIKYELEEVVHMLTDGSEANHELFRLDDESVFSDWMQTLHIHCTFQGKAIGYAFGRYVKRGRIRHDFWTQMEEPCEDLADIAFNVFDRYGRLKDDLQPGGLGKGTGVWDTELDLGDLFIIEKVIVERPWRRKGLGTAVIGQLIKKSQSEKRIPKFILVRPGWLTRDINSEAEEKSWTEAEKSAAKVISANTSDVFFRSLGFRRIGASSCFALSLDLSHKSHTISANEDFDPEYKTADEDFQKYSCVPLDWPGAFFVSGSEEKEPARLERLKSRMPLYYAVDTLTDLECVKFYNKFLEDNGKDSFDDESAKVDNEGRNVLHIAAIQLKLGSLRWLLKNADVAKRLSSVTDIYYRTPLEALKNFLEDRRTMEERGRRRICISDEFKGHSQEAIGCLISLVGLDDVVTNDHFLRIKYGCTCGQCTDGFLSPRTKYALLCQAEVNYDILEDMGVDDKRIWVDNNDYMLEYVEPSVKQNMCTNKSLIQGFINLFGHAATTIRNNKPPTVTEVFSTYEESSEWPPVTRNFLQRGGTVESILQIIFRFAREDDEWAGNGEHMETFVDEIQKLPKCRNDHEFGFVALACGIRVSH